MTRTLKEDLIYPLEFTGLPDFEFPHSSLGYFTPYEYERWFFAAQATASATA